MAATLPSGAPPVLPQPQAARRANAPAAARRPGALVDDDVMAHLLSGADYGWESGSESSDWDDADAHLPQPGSSVSGGGHGTTQRFQLQEAAFKELAMDPEHVPENHECSICCQTVQDDVTALPCHLNGCGSIFHGDCIRPWLEKNPSCPLCRHHLQEVVAPIPEQQAD